MIESNYLKSNEDYLIKKFILILADIRIILKYIVSHRKLFEEDLSKKNLDKFIDFLFNTLMNKSKAKLGVETERTKKLTKDLCKIILNEIVLLNIQKSTDYIFGYLYNYLCAAKDKLNRKSILELIRDILLNYNIFLLDFRIEVFLHASVVRIRCPSHKMIHSLLRPIGIVYF